MSLLGRPPRFPQGEASSWHQAVSEDLFRCEWLSKQHGHRLRPLTQPPFKALFSVLYMGTSGQLWAAQAPQSQSHHFPSPPQLLVRKPHLPSLSPLAALAVLAQILCAAKGPVGVLRLLWAHPQPSQTQGSFSWDSDFPSTNP